MDISSASLPAAAPLHPSPLLARYDTLRRFPAGKYVFDAALAAFAPFNAFLGVHVEMLDAGFARTRVADRPHRRNHLRTMHAVALSGLAEVTANLAVATLLPPGGSFVVRRFAIEFVKPARGELLAECRVPLSFVVADRAEVDVSTRIRDASGEVVATATACVRVRLKAPRSAQ